MTLRSLELAAAAFWKTCGEKISTIGAVAHVNDQQWFSREHLLVSHSVSSPCLQHQWGVFYRSVEVHVHGICSTCYDARCFENIRAWKLGVLFPWLQTINGGPLLLDDDCGKLEVLRNTIDVGVHAAYVRKRLEQLYDIIAEFPESTDAVLELKDAVLQPQHQRHLVQSLRLCLQRRLLHPGANTSQIIDVYIATVKVLRLLALRDFLGDVVTDPVRAYLRKRHDTVRCIIASLADDIRGDSLESRSSNCSSPRDMNDESDDEHVQSDGALSKMAAFGEILPMLVSIYGSKEVFVNEYRKMLAERLLCNPKVINSAQEVRSLEVLKLRFGDTVFRECEVMVRDVEESKRARQLFREFSGWYSRLKAPRQLEWKPWLGSVCMDLTYGSGITKEFTVTPFHATLIMYFDGSDIQHARDLAGWSHVTETMVRRKMSRWVSFGVVTEAELGLYRVNPAQEMCRSQALVPEDEECLHYSPVAGNLHEVKRLYTSYIIGMLTNLGSLSVDQIQNMLKMFANQDDVKYSMSDQDLLSQLQSLFHEGVLDCADGAYMLRSRLV